MKCVRIDYKSQICPEFYRGNRLNGHYSPHVCDYGICLQKGEGVSIDVKGAAHDFKHAGDQRNANSQYNYRVCLRKCKGVSLDLKGAPDHSKFADAQRFAGFLSHFGQGKGLFCALIAGTNS
jgi:TPR repeat protein